MYAPFRFALRNPAGDWQCVHGSFFIYTTSYEHAALRNS